MYFGTKTLLNWSSLFVVLLFFFSCACFKTEESCSTMQSAFKSKWISSYQNDSFLFVSNLSDTLRIITTSLMCNETLTVPCEPSSVFPGGCECDQCYSSCSLWFKKLPFSQNIGEAELTVVDFGTMASSLKIVFQSKSYKIYTDNESLDISNQQSFINDTTINGNSYSNVYRLIDPKPDYWDSTNTIGSILFSTNEGIIGFKDEISQNYYSRIK